MFFHLVMVAGDTPSCAPSSLRVNIYFCGMNAKYHVFCICQIGWQGEKIKAEGKGGKRRENRIANKWEKAGKGGKRCIFLSYEAGAMKKAGRCASFCGHVPMKACIYPLDELSPKRLRRQR